MTTPPRRRIPRVRAPTRKQALIAGAAALRAKQRQYAPEALMYEHGIDSPYHARMHRLYHRCRQQADLLLALAKQEPI